MAAVTDVPADNPPLDGGPDTTVGSFVRSGLGSFLAAGTVLFASLVVGSAASLIVAGGNDLISAIHEGFLELGLWTLGGFLAAVVLALAATGRR